MMAAPKISQKRKTTAKIQKKNFAMSPAAPAIPVNPSNPATTEITKKIIAHLNI